MLKNLQNKLEVLEVEEKSCQKSLSGNFYIDCSMMDIIERLTICQAKIELLEELIEELEE